MVALGGAAHQLTVERVDALYRLPAWHPQPAAARQRLDRLVAAELPRLLASLLAPALPAGDPSLWLIRRLDVDLACDLAAVDDAHLARAWAGEVGSALMRTLARGPDGETVLRFPDRASFLARFLADLAGGQAWDRWYFAGFDSLRSLPVGAALRQALLRHPEEIPRVLARLLAAGDLEAVLAILSERSCEQVLATAAARFTAGVPDRDLLVALAAVQASLPLPDPDALARARLRLIAWVAGEVPRPGLAEGLSWIVGLAAALARMEEPGSLFEALAAGDLTAAAAVLRSAGLSQILPLLPAWSRAADGDAAWLGGLGRTLTAQRQAAGPSAESSAAGFASDFAGVFFLLPSWLALDLEALLDEAGARDRALRAALRWLALLKAFGRTRADAACRDAGLRLAAGLAGSPAAALAELAAAEPVLAETLTVALPAHLERQRRAFAEPAEEDLRNLQVSDLPAFAGLPAALDRATALVAHVLLRHFAARLMGFHRSSAEHLAVNFLAGRGEVRARDGGYRVTLPRMPLAVVARMAGANGLSYQLPWLGGANIETELPGD